MWTLSFHERAALFLQTGGVNEETEVISLGTERVPDVPLGDCEFQWLLRNLLKDLPGTLPRFPPELPARALQVQLWWRFVWRGQACCSLPAHRPGSLVCWTRGSDRAGISSCGREQVRQWCLVNLSPVEIKRAGRLAEHKILNCLGDWRLVAGGGRMLSLLAGYLGLLVIFLSP